MTPCLYKPLVFRRFRVATRCDRQRRRVARRPAAAPAQRRRAENGGKERCWRREPAL